MVCNSQLAIFYTQRNIENLLFKLGYHDFEFEASNTPPELGQGNERLLESSGWFSNKAVVWTLIADSRQDIYCALSWLWTGRWELLLSPPLLSAPLSQAAQLLSGLFHISLFILEVSDTDLEAEASAHTFLIGLKVQNETLVCRQHWDISRMKVCQVNCLQDSIGPACLQQVWTIFFDKSPFSFLSLSSLFLNLGQ